MNLAQAVRPQLETGGNVLRVQMTPRGGGCTPGWWTATPARWPCDHQRTTGLAAQGGQAADDGSGTVSGRDRPPGAGLAQVVMGDDRSEDGERASGDQVEQGELRGEDPQPCPGADWSHPSAGSRNSERTAQWPRVGGGQAEGDGADRLLVTSA
jgi:hypothetical protein